MPRTIVIPQTRITVISITDAFEKYQMWQRAQGRSEGTIKPSNSNLRKLIEIVGPKAKVHEVTPQQFTEYLAYYASKAEGTRFKAIDRARAFFKWAALVGYSDPANPEGPTRGYKSGRSESQSHPYWGARQWPKLFEAADARHPVRRALIATQVYLASRGPAEIRPLRIQDLRPESWTIHVVRGKSKAWQGDDVAVPGELRLELSRYLAFLSEWVDYQCHVPLDGGMALFPSAHWNGRVKSLGPIGWSVQPYQIRSEKAIENNVNDALDDVGYVGWRGSHTLRRWAARAYYDEWRRLGYDNALRMVQALLGHKDIKDTIRYIGITADQQARNDMMIANNGMAFEINDPSRRVADLSTIQLPASLGGEESRVTESALQEADSVVRSLAAFRQQVA